MSSNKTIQVPKVIPGDWTRLRIIVDKLKHLRMGGGSSPTFTGMTLTGLTASALVGTDASKALESVTIGTGLDYTRPTLSFSHLGIEALTDPGGDRILFWDDSETACKWLSVGDSIAITATVLDTIQDIRTSASPTFTGLILSNDSLLVGTIDVGSLLDSFNGIFLETIDFTISESGGTVTGSLEQDGGGDLTQIFSDGQTTLDCTPAKTIDLTAYVGTDAIPKEVFVYILQSGKTTLVASNSDWPATEHIKIANLVLKSVATTGTDGGALVNRNWNDHAQDSVSQGHITHIEQRLRQNHAAYKSGIALTLKNAAGATMSTTDSSTAIELVTSAGSVYQLHKQTFAATDMYTNASDDAHIVNQPTDEGGAYETTVDLVTDVTHYVDGSAAGVTIGANKYFNLVIWGVQNRSGELSHIMINLPTGQYTTEANATADINGTSVFDIPSAFKGTGFLIARLTFRLIAGPQWTYIAQEDLRGQFPGVSAGVGVSTTAHDLLSGLADDDHTQYLLADGTRALAGAWDMGSQALTNVNIDSGVITGITDLAIADGGTGQSTAQAAIDALSAVSGATNEHVLTKDTASGNAIWKVAAGGVAAHAILDGSVHTDSVADGVTRGSIIYGNSTPKWDELVIGGADTFLGSDGTDLSYRTAAQVLASLSGEATASFDWNAQNLTNVASLVVGHTSIFAGVDLETVDSGTDSQAIMMVTTYNDQAAWPSVLRFQKSNSDTKGTLSTTQDEDSLGTFNADGVNGSNARVGGAKVRFYQDGAAGATYIPGRIEFQTATNAAASSTALTIGSDKLVTTVSHIDVGGVIRVSGTRVVTTRQAAVADATGAGDVVAQLNSLLAKCRTHGLIAP